MGASTLNAYRQMRRLQIPPAFGSPFNQRVLCRSAIGKRSSTMARHAGQRRISQERLALAIKKDFNDAMVNEPESITNFLYSVRHHGILLITPIGLWLTSRTKTRVSESISSHEVHKTLRVGCSP